MAQNFLIQAELLSYDTIFFLYALSNCIDIFVTEKGDKWLISWAGIGSGTVSVVKYCDSLIVWLKDL